MQMEYPVWLGKKAVGKVEVRKQGLYWKFDCRCQLTGGVVCRLVASWPGGQERLGVPVPDGDGFRLETRIPAKRLGEDLQFSLVPKLEQQERFVPIVPEEPFSYIARIKDSYLVKRGEQVGILV